MIKFRPLSQTKFINDVNLVAYYKLEDVNDSKGAYTLTNTNTVAFSAAKFDNGADFGTTNTNKKLEIADKLGIDGGVMSVSLWVKMNTEIASGYQFFFCNSTGDTTDTKYVVQYDYNAGTRRIRFGRVRNGVNIYGYDYTITMGTTNYYHLVLTYDNTNVYGYVNGALVGSGAASGNGTGGINRTSIGVGNNDVSNEGYASATIDDVAVFNRALSAGEVAELYEAQTTSDFFELF